MNKYVFGGLMLATGLGIGGGISYLICKKKFEKRLIEELNQNQEYYIKLLGYSVDENEKHQTYRGEVLEEPFEKEEQETPETPDKKFSMTEELNRKKETLLKNKNRIRYDKFPPAYEEENKEVDEVTLAVNDDNPIDDIVIITANQFSGEHRDYEKETILWWPKNNILSTEDYDILDVPDLIGTAWMDRIGEFEKDVVYVRNNIAKTDYEIVEQHDSYYDYVE